MPENTVFCGISSYIVLDEILLFLVCYFYMHSFYY